MAAELKASSNYGLSTAAVNRYTRIFKMVDLDGSQTLDASEIKSVRVSLGTNFPKAEVNDIFEKLDFGEDPDKSFTFDQFLATMGGVPEQAPIPGMEPPSTVKPAGPSSGMLELTGKMGASTGRKRTQEVDPAFQEEVARHREALSAFQQFDLDGDGFIDFDEAFQVLNRILGLSEWQVKELMNEYDTNKDGRLSYAEFQKFFAVIKQKHAEAVNAFQQFDKDHNGFISRVEAHMVLHQVLGFSREQTKAMLTAHDVNKDGKLSYTEFVHFYENIKAKNRAAIAAFEWFDKNGDGTVTLDEAHNVLQHFLGFNVTQSKKLVEECDLDQDGKLSYTEFVTFYEKVKARKAAIDDAFRKFDPEEKGYVTVEDARNALAGLHFSDSEVKRMVYLHDENRDGVLQYEEFMRFWNV